MAVNLFHILESQRCMIRLSHQLNTLRSVERRLNNYQSKLTEAWSGAEVQYFTECLSTMRKKCRTLENDLETLHSNISRATQEYLAEMQD